MNTSQKTPSSLQVQNIHFSNGTNIGSQNIFSENVNFRKRVRIESNLDVLGKINYVDNQTGWGLPQWTFATSNSYNKETDSLIVKMKYIEDNYATEQYVTDAINQGGNRGFTYYETNTFPQVNSEYTYPYPITTLAQNTGLIIRDGQGTFMDFKFQKANVQIGNILTCTDSEGTVGWLAPGSIQVQPSSRTVLTNYGSSNDYSFRVVDTGVNNNSETRGLFVYPNMSTNLYNKAILANDFTVLGGKGTLPTSNNERTFFGPFSYGSEGLSFKATYSNGSVVYPGKARLSGGYYNSSTGEDQFLSLELNGIIAKAAPNAAISFYNTYIAQDLDTDQWTKPFVVKTIGMQDQYPVFACLKGDITNSSLNRGITINPYIDTGNYNHMVRGGDIAFISADYGDFFVDGSTNVYNETEYSLFFGPWSPYAEGIAIRPTLTIEEDASPLPSKSGYIRITSGASQDSSIDNSAPNKYIELNRNGFLIHQPAGNTITIYGVTRIVNKPAAAILNNSSTTQPITSSFTIGETGSFVPFIVNGDTYMNSNVTCTNTGTFNNIILNASNGTALSIPNGGITAGSITISYLSTFQSGITCNGAITANNQNCTLGSLSVTGNTYLSGLTVTNSGTAIHCPNGGIVSGSLTVNYSTTFQSGFTSNGAIVASNQNCSVGALTANFSSSFQSLLTLNGELRYIPGKALNYVMTCTDASSGKVEWRPPAQATFPSDFIFSNLNVTDYFEINNVCKSVDCSSTDLVLTYTMDVGTTQIYTGLTTGSTDTLKNYNPFTTYHSNHTPLNVGYISIPAQYTNKVQFNIPLSLSHNWAFRGGDSGGGSSIGGQTKFRYRVEKMIITLRSIDSNTIDYEFVYNTSTDSYDLGIFNVNYHRGDNPQGPSDDKHTMTHIFTISNPTIQFTPNYSVFTNQYHIYVQYFWEFYYLYEGDDINRINSFWGSDVPEHYFNDWAVLLNQSTPSSWYSQTIDNGDSPPTTSTVHDEQYKEKTWNHTNAFETNSLIWGSWSQNLPWKQISFLNNDSIENDKKIICSIGHFNSLLVKKDIHTSGIISCRGYMSRPGVGYETPETNFSLSNVPSSKTLSIDSVFNNYWNGQKIETWVDYTKLLTQSPNVSDYRLKSNFHSVPNVLSKICSTNIYKFDINYDMYSAVDKSGVIAHEIQENFLEFPNLVQGKKDDVNSNQEIVPQSVDYQELTIILMKGIQELKSENDKLNSKISMLEESISVLYSMISKDS